MAKNKKHARRDWGNLNHDLLVLIGSKVSYPHLLCFKEVCSSWRMAAAQRTNKKPFSMLVFFSHRDDVYDDVQFINIPQKKPYKLSKPTCSVKQSMRYEEMIGSDSEGCLVMADRRDQPSLLQLFSWTRIQLPTRSSYGGILKATLSTHNSSRFVAMMMHDGGTHNEVIIWRTGDSDWTELEGDNYIDIALCDNKLYALLDNDGSVCVESLKFGIDSSSDESGVFIEVPNLKYSGGVYVKLVCSSEGELLIVNCLKDKCIIWEVNLSEERCEQVNSLNGNTLIIGDVTSAFVLAKEVEAHGYKPNSVYVAREKFNNHSRLLRSRRAVKSDNILSVYNLEAGKIEQLWISKRDRISYCTSTQSYIRVREPYLFGFIHGVC